MKASLLALLAERFRTIDRKELYARILCGEVMVNGEVVRDSKIRVKSDSMLEFAEFSYVSRSGDKLERALDVFPIDPTGVVVLDAGSSTGGFTECLLRRGARFVHAVDVGRNQLAWSLRSREEVGVHEGTKIMSVTRLDPFPDFATADLSFRSLRGAAKHILGLTNMNKLIALVKPQFEWIDPPKSFDGVVRDRVDRVRILTDLALGLADESIEVAAAIPSPIEGRNGNREYFFQLEVAIAPMRGNIEEMVNRLVYDANESLDKGSPTNGLSGPR